MLQSPQKGVYVSMAWNPIYSNQLYLVTYNNLNSLNSKLPEGELLLLTTNPETYSLTTMSQFGVSPSISSWFSWSPDGKILAGLAQQDWPHHTSKGKLAVSYDGGKTTKLTKIPMYHRTPVWLNNKELYLQPNNKTIVKVIRDGLDFKIIETTVESEKRTSLKGSFNEAPVYRAGRKLFVGEKVVLESNDGVRIVKVDKYIIAEYDGKVVVFGDDLSLCHERRLDKKTHLLNFCSKTNTIFLLEDWKTILCYDFKTEEKPHVLFSVDMMSE